MSKHLIVVVHGVGVKEAGVSSDMLAAALRRDNFIPVSSDDFNVPEAQVYDDGVKQKLFPCRVRTYQDSTGSKPKERVIADFYWGDVTNIGKGNTGLAMGLIKTILGISHIIRENANSLFKNSAMGRGLSDLFVKILHGPIAALALLIIAGLLVSWGAGYLHDLPADENAYRNVWAFESWFAILLGILAVAGGARRLKKRTSYLEALLWSWLIISGVILTLSAASDFHPSVNAWLKAGIDDHLANTICIGDQTCIETMSGIFKHGARLVGLMLLLFLAELLIITALHFLVLSMGKPAGDKKAVPVLVPHAAAGMLILWFILIAFAFIALDSIGKFLPHEHYLQSTLFLLAAAIFFLLVLIVIVGVIMASKKRWAEHVDPASYFRSELANAERHRLIVHRWLKVALFFGFVAFAIYTLLYLSSDTEAVFQYLTTTALVIATLIFGCLAYFTAHIRAGLGIASDVITYLNNYSWNESGPDHISERTIVERILGWVPNVGEKRGYYMRRKIQDRLRVLVLRLLKEQKPDNLTIVSHSQGTIIATDVIESDGHMWLGVLPKRGRFDLVTMGSPFTHIHHHYFPDGFASVADRKKLHKRQKGSDGVLNNWHNIFRIDDFVGTHIDPNKEWPMEHAVPKNGHTDYWRDRNVIQVLEGILN